MELKETKCIVCSKPVRSSGSRASIGEMTVCCCSAHAESVDYEKQEYFDLVGWA